MLLIYSEFDIITEVNVAFLFRDWIASLSKKSKRNLIGGGTEESGSVSRIELKNLST